MNNDDKQQDGFSWKLFWLVGLAIVLTQFGIHAAELWFIDDWQTRGQFGDSFGIVTSLFSGFGFAGLICTIVLQKRQIDIQREEANLLRKETEQALNNQRRANHLSALTFLMSHYDSNIIKFSAIKREGPAGAEIKRRVANLEQRRDQLNEKLYLLHEEIIDGLGGDYVR